MNPLKFLQINSKWKFEMTFSTIFLEEDNKTHKTKMGLQTCREMIGKMGFEKSKERVNYSDKGKEVEINQTT